MKRASIALLLVVGVAAPASATGGFVCRTAGPRPVEVSMGFGHVPGAALILTRLMDNGRRVPVKSAQWWLDDKELRLLLIDPNAMREELLIRTTRNGRTYDGSVVRNGQRRWIRCREG